MSKSRKLFLGILSLLPLILMVIYLVTFFRFFILVFSHMQQPEVFPQLILQRIGWIIGFGVLMSFLTLGLLIYFIIHAVNNPNIEGIERLIWILIFIFASFVGFPVYWYMRIWRENETSVATV